MTEVMTDRLILRPLNKEALELAISDFNELERKLDVEVTKDNIGPREQSVYQIRLNDMKLHLDKYEWYTPWVLIEKKLNRIIGTIMIKNYPSIEGEVTIGYALQEPFRRQGFMKEAVSGMLDWIFKNQEVKSVIADTMKDNIPSHGLLLQLGMTIYKEDDECYWWKLPNNKHNHCKTMRP